MYSTIGTEEKKNVEEHNELRQKLLQSLIERHVNLGDDQLADIFGFSENDVLEIRKKSYKVLTGGRDANTPLTWDYVLCFNVGSEEEKRKPSSKERKGRPENSGFDEEWEKGMTQKKYFSQIILDISKRLESAKLTVKPCRNGDGTKIFLIVGITESNLQLWADERDTDLEINPIEAVKDGRKRGFPLAIRTRLDDSEKDMKDSLDIELWKHLHIQFNPRANPDIYRHYGRIPGDPSISTVFSEKARLRVIYESIIEDNNSGGAEITIQEYIKNSNHPLKACFPLHNKESIEMFEREWVRNYHWSKAMWCPLEEIRSYFGEAVGFYFAFLMFYLRWLILPSIVGFIFFIEQLAKQEASPPAIEIMSFFIIFWNVAFVDFWIRQESRYRLQWGMTKFQQKAVARPQFHGEWKHDAVTGLLSEQFSFLTRTARIVSILIVIVIFICGCVVAVIYILLLRDSDPKNLPLKVELGVANGVLISVFDAMYSFGSRYGNDYENHRTEQDYQNALISKSFIFRFFNSFASLFYLAFIRPYSKGDGYYIRYYTDVCKTCTSERIATYLTSINNYTVQVANLTSTKYSDDSWTYCYKSFTYLNGSSIVNSADAPCTYSQIQKNVKNAVLSDVRIQLASLLITAIFIQNFLELFIPYLIQKITDYRRLKKEATMANPPEHTEIEEQWEKEQYRSTLDDMSEMVIQFGYVTLFVLALPITPLLALINNVIEMKVDATKLVTQCQRPHPDGSSGLGAWVDVLAFFSYISIVTNVALMTWTTDVVYGITGNDTSVYNWSFFSILCIILGLLVGFEKFIIPDVPEEVEQAIERQRLIENVLVLGANVDADEEQHEDDDDDTQGFPFNPAAEFLVISELEEVPNTDITKPRNNNA